MMKLNYFFSRPTGVSEPVFTSEPRGRQFERKQLHKAAFLRLGKGSYETARCADLFEPSLSDRA